MKEKLIEVLKKLCIFPKSGFGKIEIHIQNFGITLVNVIESKKI